jgi:hypothetical protein
MEVGGQFRASAGLISGKGRHYSLGKRLMRSQNGLETGATVTIELFYLVFVVSS